jgi:hypothetical protein
VPPTPLLLALLPPLSPEAPLDPVLVLPLLPVPEDALPDEPLVLEEVPAPDEEPDAAAFPPSTALLPELAHPAAVKAIQTNRR